jgi:hypothetical protein
VCVCVERIEEGVERMKELKETMTSAIFDMKEAVKKEDVDLETHLMTKEESIGPEGPEGPPGFDGSDGDPGIYICVYIYMHTYILYICVYINNNSAPTYGISVP